MEKHPNADKLIVLKVNLGSEERQIVAGISKWYAPEELNGKQVVIIANLEPATLRGIESQGMLLAAEDENGVSIIAPDKKMKNGSLIR